MARTIGILAAVALAGCATAGERVAPEQLRISAHDAEQVAYTRAVTWAADAELRYAEGEAVTPAGYVMPGRGEWRFVYGSEDRSEQLVVTVTPTTVAQETRPPRTPPGFALGDAVLEDGWIDSPQALAAVAEAADAALASRPDASVSVLLVPLQPAQWLIRAELDGESRQWGVNARTGALLAAG